MRHYAQPQKERDAPAIGRAGGMGVGSPLEINPGLEPGFRVCADPVRPWRVDQIVGWFFPGPPTEPGIHAERGTGKHGLEPIPKGDQSSGDPIACQSAGAPH